MLLISPGMPTNKMVIIVKNITKKLININTIISTVQNKSITNIYQMHPKNKIITGKIQNLGKDIWTFFGSYEVY